MSKGNVSRDAYFLKQFEVFQKKKPYLIQRDGLGIRRYSQDEKSQNLSLAKVPQISVKQIHDTPFVKPKASNSIHIDQEIQTKARSPAHSQYQKLTEKLPRRVLLNFQENAIKPKELQLNLSQPRIHSPHQTKGFQKSFYLNYIDSKVTHRRPNLQLTNSLVQIQDQDLQTQKLQKVHRYNYIFHYIIGTGGFGKVWKVESKKTRNLYAMKVLSKAKVLAKKSVKSVMNEKQLLNRLRHPFLVNMVAAFQDRENLYLVMDYLSGGDMRYHLVLNRTFKEEQIKFFMACLILGLEYMHLNQVIHRDIKPENLVFDCKGYLRITDLGIARIQKPDNAGETSGTPGYMAPEVLMRQNHSFPVDYFALGAIAHEMMTGNRPYQGRTRKEIREEMISKQVQLKQKDQFSYSAQIIDFTNKLLQRKAEKRLGFNGIHELKNHPWFEGFQWEKLFNKSLLAPYQPRQDDKGRHVKDEEESQQTQIGEQQKQLRLKEVQGFFEGYTYYTESSKH